MRTKINISDDVIREAETLYETKNRARAIEKAIKDAVRFNKYKKFMLLKSRISFDEDRVKALRESLHP